MLPRLPPPAGFDALPCLKGNSQFSVTFFSCSRLLLYSFTSSSKLWTILKMLPCDKDKQGHKNASGHKQRARKMRQRLRHRFKFIARENHVAVAAVPNNAWAVQHLLCIRPVVHICCVIKSVNSRMHKTWPKRTQTLRVCAPSRCDRKRGYRRPRFRLIVKAFAG